MAKKKIKITFAFTIISGLLIWLTLSGFEGEMQYSIGIKEVKAMGEAAFDQGLRVKGFLVPGTLQRSQNSLEVNFVIEEAGQEMAVRYAKVLPDTFKDGAEVLVVGKYQREGYFDAQILMAKCPSKYETGQEYDITNYDPSKHIDELEGTN